MNITPAMTAWLAHGERGVSSNTIFGHLTGIKACREEWQHPPSDPADLNRCRQLLEQCPELQREFHRMATLGPVWARLVDHWDELCALMDKEAPEWRQGRGSAPITYKRMKELGC